MVSARPRHEAPRLGLWAQHLLLAGPFLGALAAVYRHMLSVWSPAAPDPRTGQVVCYLQAWHGHALGSFYVTRLQDVVWHALGYAGLAWMVGVVALLSGLGLRRR